MLDKRKLDDGGIAGKPNKKAAVEKGKNKSASPLLGPSALMNSTSMFTGESSSTLEDVINGEDWEMSFVDPGEASDNYEDDTDDEESEGEDDPLGYEEDVAYIIKEFQETNTAFKTAEEMIREGIRAESIDGWNALSAAAQIKAIKARPFWQAAFARAGQPVQQLQLVNDKPKRKVKFQIVKGQLRQGLVPWESVSCHPEFLKTARDEVYGELEIGFMSFAIMTFGPGGENFAKAVNKAVKENRSFIPRADFLVPSLQPMQIATKASVYALATHEPTDPSCKHYIGLFTDQDGSARLAQHKSKGVNHKTREQYASRPFDLWTKVILRSYDCRTKRQWCIASAVTYYWELNYNILTHASVTEDGGLNCQILDSIAFFTAQDEDNMCQYLAMTVPQKENGGRLGRNLWKEMVRNFHFLPEPYYWTQNHSWQSWREHYKKNQTRLDPIILRYVLKAKPTAKSTFGYCQESSFSLPTSIPVKSERLR